jgi:hypothetical protein
MALVDTTTLFTALRLVDADNATLATPLTVLDLTSFLDAAACTTGSVFWRTRI